jgi:phosphoserine phosphatase
MNPMLNQIDPVKTPSPSSNAIELEAGLKIQGFSAPLNWTQFKLIAFDMDSTLINIECIDELAREAGVGQEVTKITEAAMRGEIKSFSESLKKRLPLLKGAPQDILQKVLLHRLQLNPGAQTLVQTCQAHGLKTLLVSGGFTYFAREVQSRLNIDFMRSNELNIQNGCLTGELIPQSWGLICDAEEKRNMILQTCSSLNITAAQVIAVGDGANDLPMMKLCSEAGGLSVAYHAKPIVREQAMVSIESGGLDQLLKVLA